MSERSGTLGVEYLDLVWQLYNDVSAKVHRKPIFTQLLDHALLCLELRRALGDDCGAADPKESFVAAMGVLPHEPEAGPWLYRGAAQAGWLAIQLARGTASTTPPPSTRPISNLTIIDDLVLSWLLDYPENADLDLPRGVIGLGVYAFAHPDRGVRDKLLTAVVNILEDRLDHDPTGTFIRLPSSPEREREGSAGCRSIGVAHGTAGLVSFLSSIRMSGSASLAERTTPMLNDALRWLLAQRVDRGNGVFPHRVELAERAARPTWCSGDPGVGLALGLAAQATGSPAAHKASSDVARAVLSRPHDDSGVVDACLCHGSAGLIWYGHRLVGDLGLTGGAHLADHWARWTRTQREAGFLTYFGPWGMIRGVTFLEGDCGAALSLLAAVRGGDPCWQELLLAVRLGAS